MATITVNGKTTEIPAHVLHTITEEMYHWTVLTPSQKREINYAAIRASELREWIADAVSSQPEHYHVECSRNALGHYVTEPEWDGGRKWLVRTLCGIDLHDAHRVDATPGPVGPPTPLKSLCPGCKMHHDKIERWKA